jgi:hypothetical protein
MTVECNITSGSPIVERTHEYARPMNRKCLHEGVAQLNQVDQIILPAQRIDTEKTSTSLSSVVGTSYLANYFTMISSTAASECSFTPAR